MWWHVTFLEKDSRKSLRKIKRIKKLENHCHFTGKYRGAADSVCNLRFKVANEIILVFHNASNYDHYLIIKELTSQFEQQFKCLGQNIEKYKKFSVLIEKKIRELIKMVVRIL